MRAIGPHALDRRYPPEPLLDRRAGVRDVVVVRGRLPGRRIGIGAEGVERSAARLVVRLKVEEERAVVRHGRVAQPGDPPVGGSVAGEEPGATGAQRLDDLLLGRVEARRQHDHALEAMLGDREQRRHVLVVAAAPRATAAQQDQLPLNLPDLLGPDLAHDVMLEQRPGARPDELVAAVAVTAHERQVGGGADRVEQRAPAPLDRPRKTVVVQAAESRPEQPCAPRGCGSAWARRRVTSGRGRSARRRDPRSPAPPRTGCAT